MNNEKRVLIYCRESRDDYGEKYDRIETQRDILIKYCHNQGYTNIVDIIMDDNMSGTKFERLDKVKQKIENKEIDVIVFKDGSRLGRNQNECLSFIEFADEYNVEVLFESEKYNEEFFGLHAWFNEQRAREDSKKIRRVIEHKMTSGELLVKPLYGYNKVENQYIINEEQANVVREIFEMYINNIGTHAIATKLNLRNILTPSQENKQMRICYAWNQQHIYRIINNETYTGKMIYHKKTVKSFKNKKVVPVDKKNWIIIENHHEPIISEETFKIAQSLKKECIMSNYRGIRSSLFSGIIFCGKCGSSMLRVVRKGRNTAYVCAKNRKEGAIKNDIRSKYGCETHHITEREIIEKTLEIIKSFLNPNQEKIYENVKRKRQSNDNKENIISILQKEINDIERKIELMYDDKLNGIIPQNIYIKKYNEFNDKLKDLRSEYEKLQYVKPKISADMNTFRRIVLSGEFTNKDLKDLFTKIVVYVPNEITERDKLMYDISDELFQDIYLNGGVLFQEKFTDGFSYVAH